MPDQLRPGPARYEATTDPIVYSDEVIFGLDPAVHWVAFNGQKEQFSEIVVEIAKHWSDGPWLNKLLNRLGYNVGIYDTEKNPGGIFSISPRQIVLVPVRLFLLRAAGVKSDLLAHMFQTNRTANNIWRLAKAATTDVSAKRKALRMSTLNRQR